MKGIPLALKYPKLATEWHPTKNGNLTPNDISGGSEKKVWWKCPKGEDHEWETSPNKRTSRGDGCTICSNRKIVKSNCLNTTHPEVANEWHETKNTKNTYNVSGGSNEYAWWKCSKNENHIWKAKISNRTINKNGCPFCSNLKRGERRKNAKFEKSIARLYPEISKFWDYDSNIKKPETIYPTSSIKYYWFCDKKEHPNYLMGVAERIKSKYNCPICAKEGAIKSKLTAKKEQSFGVKFPHLLNEWDYKKNGSVSPFSINPFSHRKYWWICKINKDHIYQCSLSNKTNQSSNCPFCRGLKVNYTNSLQVVNPKLAEEWHKTKNTISPNEVSIKSHKKIWWQCKKNIKHIWLTSISNRQNTGCPYCVGQKTLIEDSVGKLYPKLLNEWDFEKNLNHNPYELSPKSGALIWWKCSKDDKHTWRTRVSHRTVIRTGCPYCTLTPQSKQELQITFELKYIFKTINPLGHKFKIENKIFAIDIFIPEIQLAIEFDGSYWHKNRTETDQIKTEQLLKFGINVLRIREHPLKKILETDIISEQPFNAKIVSNNVLKYIDENYQLNQITKLDITNYLRKKDSQNETELERYIGKLLDNKRKKV